MGQGFLVIPFVAVKIIYNYNNLCLQGDLARKFQYRPWNPGVQDQLAREIVQPEVAQYGELMIIACPSLVHAACTCALYWNRIGDYQYHRTTTLACKGILKIISMSMASAICHSFGLNLSIPIQVIRKCSNLFLDKKKWCRAILHTARMKCKLIRTLIDNSMCYMVCSAWDVRGIRDLHVKGLMPDVVIQFFRSISLQTVDRTSNLQKQEVLIVSGVLMVALTDKLRAVDLWTAKIIAAYYVFQDDLINVLGKPLKWV
jgi:hypothetical protein